MKTIKISTFLILAVLVAACGEQDTDSLEGKKARLGEIKSEIESLNQEMVSLEAEIKSVDPNFGKGTDNSTLVTTLTAAKQPFQHKIEVRGNVESRTNVNISAETMGQLTAVNVVEGQYVRRGQVIATIDSETIEKNIAEVETQLDFATTVFEKRERLWKRNIGTEIDYLTAKNNKESLERTLETLQTQLEKTKIKAPFNGTIEQVPVNRGQMVQPGMPVAFLVSNDNMYISADVSEKYVGRFQTGDSVTVMIPSLGETFESTITAVGQVINQASRTFSVEVKLPKVDEYLKTNLITVIQLVDYEAEEAVVIPSRIIQEDLEGTFIYQANGQKAERVAIELGLTYDGHSEVVSGLNGGETVIDKGNRIVADGTSIKIQK